jgi:hypothetical protein
MVTQKGPEHVKGYDDDDDDDDDDNNNIRKPTKTAFFELT